MVLPKKEPTSRKIIARHLSSLVLHAVKFQLLITRNRNEERTLLARLVGAWHEIVLSSRDVLQLENGVTLPEDPRALPRKRRLWHPVESERLDVEADMVLPVKTKKPTMIDTVDPMKKEKSNFHTISVKCSVSHDNDCLIDKMSIFCWATEICIIGENVYFIVCY